MLGVIAHSIRRRGSIVSDQAPAGCLLRPLHIDIDAQRIAQILGNLLQNTAKFTDPDGLVEMALETVLFHRRYAA